MMSKDTKFIRRLADLGGTDEVTVSVADQSIRKRPDRDYDDMYVKIIIKPNGEEFSKEEIRDQIDNHFRGLYRGGEDE
mgnify:CR=1 FL=1